MKDLLIKKRVIMLISSSIAGGAQNYLYNLVNHFKDKYDILVICPLGFLSEKLRKIDGIDIKNMIFDWSTIKVLHSVFAEEAQQYKNIFINAHLLGTALLTCLALEGIANFRLSVTIHNKIIYDGISLVKRLSFPGVIKYIARHTDQFIAVSDEIARSVKEYIDKPCVYIPSSVPLIIPPKTVEAYAPDKGQINVAAIGRLSKQKNLFCFLDAAALIKDKMPNMHFFLIGDGELRYKLTKYVIFKNLENDVSFTGFLNDPSLKMQEMDILVISSDTEGTPLVLLEAMSMGLPVVSTNVGGIPNVIENGVDGILVEKRKPDELAEAVIKLASDKALYQKVSLNSITKIKTTYSIERNYVQYSQALEGDN